MILVLRPCGSLKKIRLKIHVLGPFGSFDFFFQFPSLLGGLIFFNSHFEDFGKSLTIPLKSMFWGFMVTEQFDYKFTLFKLLEVLIFFQKSTLSDLPSVLEIYLWPFGILKRFFKKYMWGPCGSPKNSLKSSMIWDLEGVLEIYQKTQIKIGKFSGTYT